MEYGLYVSSSTQSLLKDPRDLCATVLRPLLPKGELKALYFGSEFCQERLPSLQEAEAVCERAHEEELEAVFLTPLVTEAGLLRLANLLSKLSQGGWKPAVVFNDWGVLELVRSTHPTISLRMGRLMNRGLRDPRLTNAPSGSGRLATGRGSRVRALAVRLGVCAVETDADLEPGFLGDGREGMQRTLHLPYTFATSGRNCLEKAAQAKDDEGSFIKGLDRGCSAPCRGLVRPETRADTDVKLWRAGNTLFFQTPLAWAMNHLSLTDRVVLHERPTP